MPVRSAICDIVTEAGPCSATSAGQWNRRPKPTRGTALRALERPGSQHREAPIDDYRMRGRKDHRLRVQRPPGTRGILAPPCQCLSWRRPGEDRATARQCALPGPAEEQPRPSRARSCARGHDLGRQPGRPSAANPGCRRRSPAGPTEQPPRPSRTGQETDTPPNRTAYAHYTLARQLTDLRICR
jgi:hypothetical protein